MTCLLCLRARPLGSSLRIGYALGNLRLSGLARPETQGQKAMAGCLYVCALVPIRCVTITNEAHRLLVHDLPLQAGTFVEL